MNRTRVLVLSIIALVLVVIFIFFKVADVPDIDRGGDYDPEEMEMQGLWMFHNMMKEAYGGTQVETIRSDEFSYLSKRTNSLLVIIRKNVGLDSTMRSIIDDFVSRGNEVLLVGNHFNLQSYEWYRDVGTTTYHDTIFRLSWTDGEEYVHYPYVRDSSFIMKSSLSCFYRGHTSDTLDSDYDEPLSDFTDLATLTNGKSFFRRMSGKDSSIYIHSIPMLFANITALNDSYRENFNKTFSHFGSDNVIIHTFIRNNILAGNNEDSLLKYILSQRALKYAYYLLILLSLIYIFFSSKRKQKSIPISKPIKNTSLEYIHTVSELFKAQQQNQKLVPHMKRNFYSQIRKKYYLDPDHPEFASKLSRKSKVPIDIVESITKQLKIAEHYSYNDDQLIRLYNDINTFHKNSK